jgi:lysophospholipase L1-like esterase
MRVVNAGVPGATTAELRLELPELLDTFQPDCLVLEAGINDLKLLGIRPALSNELVALVFTNLSALVDQGLAQHARVVLLPTWPAASPEPARRPVWSAAIPAAVLSLNQRLAAAMANRENVRVPDLFSRAGITPGKGTYRDALHLRPEIYDQLTPLLLAEVSGESGAK